MSYVISVSNGKGGVAKTTTSISLGCSLADMGHRVLLIDLDRNANLTLGFGTIPKHVASFSKDLFAETRANSVKCTETGYKNLELIPSDGDMASIEERTLSLRSSATVLRLALKSNIPRSYDFIIIDCPAALGYLTTNALTASDLLIIPTQAEFYSAYALQTMFTLIRDIRQNRNPDLIYRILVTMLDLRLRDHLNILNQLQKHLSDSLYKTRIMVDTHFRGSSTQGVPITYSNPTSRGAIQYRDLAQEILNDLKKGTQLQEQTYVSQAVANEGLARDRANQTAPLPTLNSPQKTYTNYTLISRPNENQPMERKNGNGLFCPHLGREEDAQTMLAYPSSWNKCYRAKPAVSPSLIHQNTYCISSKYHLCPMLQNTKKRSLPSNLRAPMDNIEKLQYIKNWIRAKIT